MCLLEMGKNGPTLGLLGGGAGWLSGSFEGRPWPR